MKKALGIFVASIFLSAVAFGQAFVPQTMELNKNHPDRSSINYNWTQSSVSIPVELQGASAKATLMIYTNGQDQQIANVRNGYLGWHYVNKVDTCLYVSGESVLTPGDNNIVWDMNGKDGAKIAKQNLNYYVFAYEYNTPKTLVMKRGLSGTAIGVYREAYLDPMGPGGTKRTAPMILFRSRRWVVGGDPNDVTNYKTTSDFQTCKYALDINDDSYMYRAVTYSTTYSLRVTKWQFVENGPSIQDATWAGNGYVDTHAGYWGTIAGGVTESAGVQRDANFLYVTGNQRSNTMVEFYTIDPGTGTILKNWSLGDIYLRPGGPRSGLYVCGGPLQQSLVNPFTHTKVLLQHHGFCWRVMVDPTAGLNDDNDFRTWVNGNGDFFTDHNMEDPNDSLYQECNDVNKFPYCYQLTGDENGVSVVCTNTSGYTFGLMGPDGTGAGMHTLYGEGTTTKFACQFFRYGTQWDGLYGDANSTDFSGTADASGAYYTPANTFKGELKEVSLNSIKETPGSFSVAQNSPNPFNPSTDIKFTVPNKGLVTVDIFNVAGQKVTSIRNNYSQAGTYKVTWNAANMSAGIYFYTVTQGNFSKTMKMTLAK